MQNFVIILSFIFLSFSTAQGACTSPAGDAGKVIWHSGKSLVYYCNGTNWREVMNDQPTEIPCPGVVAGTIGYNSGTTRFCDGTNWGNMKGALIGSCAGTTAGTQQYDATTKMFRFCDGTNWYDMSKAKRMFISATTADGANGSLANADTLCTTDATTNGLGGTWKAWISNSTTNAIDRISDLGPWYRIDKATLITYNKTTLASGTLVNSIDSYPNGTSAGGAVIWTGTATNGTASVLNCADWTLNAESGRTGVRGDFGVANSATSTWTIGAAGTVCSSAAIYSRICIEQ